MKNINQLSDQEIIEQLKTESNKFRELYFLVKCEPIIDIVIDSYQEEKNIFLNEEAIKKSISEKIKNLLKRISREELIIKESFSGYIRKSVYNFLNEEARGIKAGTIQPKYRLDLDETTKSRTEIKTEFYSKGPGTILYYDKRISDDTWESILRSLKYIKGIYKTKENILSDPIFKVLDILSNTKTNLRYMLNMKLGSNVDNMISRYNELLKAIGKRKLEKLGLPTLEEVKAPGATFYEELSKNEFDTVLKESLHPDPANSKEFLSKKEQEEFKVLKKSSLYWSQVEKIDNQLSDIQKYSEHLILRINKSLFYIFPSKNSMITHQATNIIKFLKNFKVQPPRFMFEVWKEDKALSKGKKLDRKLFLRIFRDLKEKTKDTSLEFLFDSIDAREFQDRQSAIRFFENIRKSTYEKPNNAKSYKKLIESIYQVSFIEEIEADDMEKLSEYFTKKLINVRASMKLDSES